MMISAAILTLSAALASVAETPHENATHDTHAALESAPVETAPAAIPLIGWWGPPPSARAFSMYSHAFLNQVPIMLRRARPDALDLAQDHGLPVVLELPSDAPFDLDAIPEAVRNHPAVTACIVAEGVTAESAPEAIRRAEALRARQPGWLPIATLLPDLDDPAWEAAAASLAAAGVPVLPWVFPFADDDSTDEAGLYAVMRAAARAAERGGGPWWGVVQVTEHADRRRASESDMRLQAYASLAHGARGLVYYSYWGPRPGSLPPDHPLASFGLSMVDTGRGVPAYGHQMARILNAEITLMSPYLKALTPTGVYFVGDIPEGGEPLGPGSGPITRVDSPRALVGLFDGEDGETWALVVNRQHGVMRSARTQGRTIGIAFADDVRAIDTVERQTGRLIPIPVDEGYFAITIPGGTGSLLRFQRAQDDAQ